jgi:hypothetical protein
LRPSAAGKPDLLRVPRPEIQRVTGGDAVALRKCTRSGGACNFFQLDRRCETAECVSERRFFVGADEFVASLCLQGDCDIRLLPEASGRIARLGYAGRFSSSARSFFCTGVRFCFWISTNRTGGSLCTVIESLVVLVMSATLVGKVYRRRLPEVANFPGCSSF